MAEAWFLINDGPNSHPAVSAGKLINNTLSIGVALCIVLFYYTVHKVLPVLRYSQSHYLAWMVGSGLLAAVCLPVSWAFQDPTTVNVVLALSLETLYMIGVWQWEHWVIDRRATCRSRNCNNKVEYIYMRSIRHKTTIGIMGLYCKGCQGEIKYDIERIWWNMPNNVLSHAEYYFNKNLTYNCFKNNIGVLINAGDPDYITQLI